MRDSPPYPPPLLDTAACNSRAHCPWACIFSVARKRGIIYRATVWPATGCQESSSFPRNNTIPNREDKYPLPVELRRDNCERRVHTQRLLCLYARNRNLSQATQGAGDLVSAWAQQTQTWAPARLVYRAPRMGRPPIYGLQLTGVRLQDGESNTICFP